MQKIKLLTTLLYGFIVILLAVPKPASASVLSIQTLPSYITTNSFKLSCTSDGGTVQFSVSKHGGAFVNFGSAIDTSSNPCVVQVDSSVVNDQTDYTFSAGGKTTSTFYDISGPSGVSNYYKEHINDGFNKLHWRNPGDSDFDKVVIYRGDAAGFSADASHEIARVSGGANSDMTYDDHYSPDPNKNYYYAIRALDHAGNSSSLVGDAGTVQGTATPAGVLGTSTTGKTSGGKVTVLPKEEGQGGVLPAATVSPAPTQTPPSEAGASAGLLGSLSTKKKLALGLGVLALLGLGYYLYKKSS